MYEYCILYVREAIVKKKNLVKKFSKMVASREVHQSLFFLRMMYKNLSTKNSTYTKAFSAIENKK